MTPPFSCGEIRIVMKYPWLVGGMLTICILDRIGLFIYTGFDALTQGGFLRVVAFPIHNVCETKQITS